MIKNTLLIIILLTLQNAFAQCTEQKNFDVNWNIDSKNISYEIKRKDEVEFSYYKNGKNFIQLYNGIKLDKPIKIGGLNYAIFRSYNSVDLQRVIKLLEGNNNQLSLYINSYGSSEVYLFPFEKNMFVNTKIINEKINLEQYQSVFTRDNKIYGTHNIKYYIILFHDEYGRKCSYFESPEVEYNFGTKLLSLIWKDFWN